jgi:ketosteroid isomerase-like protein
MSELNDFYHNLMGAVTAGDADRVRSLIDPSFVIYNDASMPYGGVYHGPEGFLGMIGEVYRTWRDAKVENLHLLEDADGHNITFVDKLTGRPGKCQDLTEAIVSELWTVRDGKAVEARIWFWNATHLSKLILEGTA